MSCASGYVVRARASVDPAVFAAAQKGTSAPAAVETLRRSYGADAGFLLGASRQALALVLAARGIGEGDAVVLADFNCSTVLSSIESVGARGVFVDVRDDWTYDLDQLAAACSPSGVRALVITHFFGRSAWTSDLLSFVADLRRRGVLIIEDCAHSMMDPEQPEIGRTGDVVLFSTGNDKLVSVGKCGVLLVRGAAFAEAVVRRHAALPVRSEGEERLLAVWSLVYWAMTAPEVCHPGIVSVLPRTNVRPSAEEYAELVTAFAEAPTLGTLARFPSAAALVANAGVSGAPLSSDPFRAGPLMEGLFNEFLAKGSLVRENARRSENRAALDRGLGVMTGRGSRLRYTLAFPDAASARAATERALTAGLEVGCYNWSPLLSEEWGISREIPVWAVRPERTVNFPVHLGVGEDEIAGIISAVAASRKESSL